MTSQLPHSIATLYEQDYHLWLEKMAQLLRTGQVSELDWMNLAEEISDMGRSERRAVESNLEIVLMHLLKYCYQPEGRSASWRYTLLEHRRWLERAFQDSPSLKPYFAPVFAAGYQAARRLASTETDLPIEQFPPACPFTPAQVLDLDYLPE